MGLFLDREVLLLQLLHQSRVKADAAREPRAAALLERLRRDNCIYATPFGSNDDWYWLYAAVNAGELLQTYPMQKPAAHTHQLGMQAFLHECVCWEISE